MTGPLRPRKGSGKGRDTGIPEKVVLGTGHSVCKEQGRAVEDQRRRAPVLPPPTRWRPRVGFPLGGCGRAAGGGGWAGTGAGAGWGLWAAGWPGTQRSGGHRGRSGARAPTGARLHGGGPLRAVATRQPLTSAGPQRLRLRACLFSLVSFGAFCASGRP